MRRSWNLKPVAPFRLDLTVWALRRRPENIIDRWDDGTYRRTLVLIREPLEVCVRQTGPADNPVLEVTVTGERLSPDIKPAVEAALRRLLGTRTDLTDFYLFAERDPEIASLAQRFRGLKPPRFCTVFEALVNGIVCQQITLTVGIRLLNRLVIACGTRAPSHEKPSYAFPRPGDLTGLDPKTLRAAGLSRQKAFALIELARWVDEGKLDEEELAALDDEAAVALLRQMRGVGRWTAEYVLLRGLGKWHVFPGDDAGARNSLTRWLGMTDTLDREKARQAVSRWGSYGGLLYFHLLLDGLSRSAYVF